MEARRDHHLPSNRRSAPTPRPPPRASHLRFAVRRFFKAEARGGARAGRGAGWAFSQTHAVVLRRRRATIGPTAKDLERRLAISSSRTDTPAVPRTPPYRVSSSDGPTVRTPNPRRHSGDDEPTRSTHQSVRFLELRQGALSSRVSSYFGGTCVSFLETTAG